MIFLLQGISGPYQNKYFKVAAGMSIGRRQGEIILEADSAVSSLHGRVISLGNGQLCLKDAGSQNQFLVNGKKVDSVILSEGTVFQIGQSLFQVVSSTEKKAASLGLEKNWKDVIFESLDRNVSMTSQAKALSPVVTVECIKGPSAEVSWFLAFGPRLFGPLCEDIEILEKDSHDIAFEISQGAYGPIVRPFSKNALVNNNQVSEKSLEDGDEIQVGSSIFKIRLG